MMEKTSANIVDSGVPKSRAMNRLSEWQKKALEKSELAEHAHGEEREKLQEEARRSADQRSTND